MEALRPEGANSGIFPGLLQRLELDCRVLDDSGRDKSLAKHCGRHDSTMLSRSRHEEFPGLMHRVAKRVQGTPKKLLWSFFCRQGRHRSVATAMLVSKALASLGTRVRVEYIEHRNGGWAWLCFDSPSCDYGTPEKEQLVAFTKETLQQHL